MTNKQMTNEEILQEVESLEKKLTNPNVVVPDTVKEKIKSRIQTLKSQLEKVEEKQEKVEKEEKKSQDSLEESIDKLQKLIDNPKFPASSKEGWKNKLAAAKKELAEQKKEIKEDKKEAQQEKKEVKKAVEKLEKVAKRKTPIKKAKKEVEVKKVKIKEKAREVKVVKRKRKLKIIMTSLEKLISKNSRLKKDYLTKEGKSKVKDLDRDAGRSAKPIGFRFRGKHDYRKPTPTEVTKGLKRGTVYKESRPNRGDVFPKGYRGSISGLKKKKFEEGGMADGGMEMGGMEMKKGGMSPQKKAANHGRAWTIDHEKHNKKQGYEIPLNKRK
jgi:chemotaxis protein histidine kinase CheA